MKPSKIYQGVKRVGKLGLVAASATRLKLSKTKENRMLARKALVALFADARGIPMKIGQWLSTIDPCAEYGALAKGIPPRPLSHMLPVLEEEFDKNLKNIFLIIEESKAAASLGQVHKAQLLDGTWVALKIQYPDIQEAVDTEMALLGLLPGMGPSKKWGFDISGYKEMFRSNMKNELDYRSEAYRQESFKDNLSFPGLVVPRVFPKLCTQRVLVQEWKAGGSLEMTSPWPVEDRRKVGKILLGTLFQSLFQLNEIHGDPHLGNAFYNTDKQGNPQVVLLDYGCTVSVKENTALALLKLIVGAREGGSVDPLACLIHCGFNQEKLHHIADSLPALTKLIMEPFILDQPFSTKEWDLASRMDSLLGDLRWWFRSSGPPHLIFLLRAFQGVVSQLESLGVGLSWWEVLEEAIGSERIEEAKNFQTPISLLQARKVQSFETMAKYLKVLVTEGKTQVVALSLPASTVPNLRNTMPENVLDDLKNKRIDIDEIIRKACVNGIGPQKLFQMDSGKRNYKVWLE